MRFKGELLRSTGDFSGAIAEFDKILAKHPNDLAARLSRGNVLIVLGRLDDAQKDIDAALKIAPHSIPAIYLDALLLAREGHLDKADDLLDTISQSFTALPQGYYLQGAVKYALGQYEQAETSLGKYLARKPDQPGALRLLALVALRKKDPERRDHAAEAGGRTPIRATPPRWPILAQAYVASGKKDEAVELYEQAAAHQSRRQRRPDPRGPDARALRRCDRRRHRSREDRRNRQGRGRGRADSRAERARTGRRRKAAAADAESLAKRQPGDPIVQNLLGSVRIAQQRFADAGRDLRRPGETGPGFSRRPPQSGRGVAGD